MARKVDSRFVWMDGRVVPADEAKVSFFAHVLHYGTGVFEGIRCYDGRLGPAVFRLPDHLQRLRRSASGYFMEYRWTDEELSDAILDLIRRHRFRECYIRPLVLTGEGYMGVRPRECEVVTCIAVWSWGAYLGPEALEKGIRAKITKQRKYLPTALDPTIKATGHYLNSVLASKEAAAGGYQEGILLNAFGRVAEGAGENIFIVRRGTLITNDPTESLLPGITRDSVIQLAEHLAIPVEIRPLPVEDLLTADEAFMTGTAAEVTPIAEVNDSPIGSGRRGPITERLQRAYLDVVRGRLPGFEHWLTPVEG
jgi:branched-chain amino acid aminotransferase